MHFRTRSLADEQTVLACRDCRGTIRTAISLSCPIGLPKRLAVLDRVACDRGFVDRDDLPNAIDRE